MGAGPGERVSQERDMRPEVLPLQKLHEEVGEEEGKCWQRRHSPCAFLGFAL